MKYSSSNNSWHAQRNKRSSPHPAAREAREALRSAREATPAAIECLLTDFLQDPDCPRQHKLKAIQVILDRGLGKVGLIQIEEQLDKSMDDMTPAERIEILHTAIREQEQLQAEYETMITSEEQKLQ